MKTLLIGFLVLGSFSAFADQFRCESEKGEITLSITERMIDLDLGLYEEALGRRTATFSNHGIDFRNIRIAKVPRKYAKDGVNAENDKRRTQIHAYTWDGGLGSNNLKFLLNKRTKEMKVKLYHEALLIKDSSFVDKLNCENSDS